jgi:hypothetical protein
VDRQERQEPDQIYATHGHADHFFGVGAVLERFPNARFVARPEVIKKMREQTSPETLHVRWNARFPGQISDRLIIAEELSGSSIELEGTNWSPYRSDIPIPIIRPVCMCPQLAWSLLATSHTTASAKTQRHSCSAGQEAVLVVKSVQDGPYHNSA